MSLRVVTDGVTDHGCLASLIEGDQRRDKKFRQGFIGGLCCSGGEQEQTTGE